MKHALRIGACLAGLALHPEAASAWGPNGHRITAQVAQNNLSKETATQLKQLLGSRSLALVATWPDFVRSFPQYDCFKPWHFLTVEDGQPIEDARNRPADLSKACDKDAFATLDMPGNVVDAITFFAAIVAGDADKADRFAQLLNTQGAAPFNDSIEVTALVLLVHLVGDVHQPLHVGRGDDRGGNGVEVFWFDEPVKLHEVWDEKLIDKEALSYSEFAAFLDQEFGNDVPDPSPPVTWALESVDYRKQVYDFGDALVNGKPNLSYSYAAQNDTLFKSRMHIGGLRLAALLTDILVMR